jgi:predicted amidohydrolase YtcJ
VPEQLTLTGARLVGGDGVPVDLVVSDGRLVDIRPTGSARGHLEPLDGRWVMPGLWDHHVHMDQWALSRRRLDLRAATSAAETAEVVRARLREVPQAAGAPLIGYGFHDALWPDRPTAELLDNVAGGLPVALYSNDMHCAWVSSAAWGLLGRDDGPTVVYETEFQALLAALREHETASLPSAVRDAVASAARRGSSASSSSSGRNPSRSGASGWRPAPTAYAWSAASIPSTWIRRSPADSRRASSSREPAAW